MIQCEITGCKYSVNGRSKFCKNHYHYYRRTVTPESPESRTKRLQYQRNRNELPKPRYASLRSKCARLGLEFDLSFSDYENLIKQKCFYCEGALCKSGIGLDRANNHKGYTIKNAVPCCRTCNTLKSNLLSKDEMLNVIALLRDSRGGKVWSKE